MLSLFFDMSFYYDILIAVCIIAVVIACIKYPGGRLFLLTGLFIILVISAVYSCIQLNYYYKAKGGIYGQIDGIFKPNNVEIVQDLEFDFKDIMMTESSVKDRYKARFIDNKVLSLTSDKYYGVFVNDYPCMFNEIGTDYVLAQYQYNFYDDNKNLLLNDTLTFKFAFYSKQCVLEVSTDGGSEANDFWNSYFNKNVFKVKVKELDNQYITSNVFSNYSKVDFEFDNEIIKKSLIKNGSFATDFIPSDRNDKRFNYWMVDNVRVNVSEYKITEETHFVASLSELRNVYFYDGENLVNHQKVILGDSPNYVENTNSGFLGWSLDKINVVNVLETSIYFNTDFYAVYDDYDYVADLNITIFKEILTKINAFDENVEKVVSVDNFSYIGRASDDSDKVVFIMSGKTDYLDDSIKNMHNVKYILSDSMLNETQIEKLNNFIKFYNQILQNDLTNFNECKSLLKEIMSYDYFDYEIVTKGYF